MGVTLFTSKQKVMQQHIYYIKFALRFADMQIPELVNIFGVNVVDPYDGYLNGGSSKWMVIGSHGYDDEANYLQNVYTVRDGWGHDFYYYSPPPYQSYTLWSSGPNGRTFPPWMEKPSGQEDRINGWIKDDIKAGDK